MSLRREVAIRYPERIIEDRKMRFSGRFVALGLFAVAMAYLESAVVVYLRMLYYPEGFEVILKPMPLRTYLIELGREAATIVMLVVTARLSFRSFWMRFSSFLYLFAIWDLFYYLWLYVFIQWPPSLATWDILFLIPVAWVGPVWSPVAVSFNFVLASLFLNIMIRRGIVLTARWYHWAIAILGAAMIFYSYMVPLPELLKGMAPTRYAWTWLVAGLAVGWGAFILALATRSWVRVEEVSRGKSEDGKRRSEGGAYQP